MEENAGANNLFVGLEGGLIHTHRCVGVSVPNSQIGTCCWHRIFFLFSFYSIFAWCYCQRCCSDEVQDRNLTSQLHCNASPINFSFFLQIYSFILYYLVAATEGGKTQLVIATVFTRDLPGEMKTWNFIVYFLWCLCMISPYVVEQKLKKISETHENFQEYSSATNIDIFNRRNKPTQKRGY